MGPGAPARRHLPGTLADPSRTRGETDYDRRVDGADYTHRDSATTAPGSPPIGALGRRLADVQRRGQFVGLALGFLVGLGVPLLVLPQLIAAADRANPLPTLWAAAAMAIGGLFVGAAIMALLPPFLMSRANRTASVVHAWIGAREVRRLLGKASSAITIPTTPEDASRWLATTPDTPALLPLRFELLVLTRRFDEARAAAERLPRRTSLDEYRYVEALAMVADQSSGGADLAGLREAAERVTSGVDRAEARASLAIFEARLLSGGEEWRRPLAGARPAIPERDVTILLRDLALPIFTILARRLVLPLALFIVLVAVTLSVFMAL